MRCQEAERGAHDVARVRVTSARHLVVDERFEALAEGEGSGPGNPRFGRLVSCRNAERARSPPASDERVGGALSEPGVERKEGVMEDLERDVVRLQERVARLESLRQRFYDIMPAAVNIAVILFVIVQLMGFDDRLDGVEQRLDGVEQRMDALEQRMTALERNQERILELLDER